MVSLDEIFSSSWMQPCIVVAWQQRWWWLPDNIGDLSALSAGRHSEPAAQHLGCRGAPSVTCPGLQHMLLTSTLDPSKVFCPTPPVFLTNTMHCKALMTFRGTEKLPSFIARGRCKAKSKQTNTQLLCSWKEFDSFFIGMTKVSPKVNPKLFDCGSLRLQLS